MRTSTRADRWAVTVPRLAQVVRGRWPALAIVLARLRLPGQAAMRPIGLCRPTSRDFALLYATNCAGCHGADGRLGPAPPLNDPLFLAIVPDASLFRT